MHPSAVWVRSCRVLAMDSASNTPAPAERAAGADDTRDSLASAVREIAEHLRHVAELATIAAGGEEPERGAQHLLAGCDELAPKLRALACRLGPLAVALLLV